MPHPVSAGRELLIERATWLPVARRQPWLAGEETGAFEDYRP
jgi:hypothetical protein